MEWTGRRKNKRMNRVVQLQRAGELLHLKNFELSKAWRHKAARAHLSIWPGNHIWRHIYMGQHRLNNGLLPDGTKPLPESMLTYHQHGPVTFLQKQFHKRYMYLGHQITRVSCLSKVPFESSSCQWIKSYWLFTEDIPIPAAAYLTLSLGGVYLH